MVLHHFQHQREYDAVRNCWVAAAIAKTQLDGGFLGDSTEMRRSNVKKHGDVRRFQRFDVSEC